LTGVSSQKEAAQQGGKITRIGVRSFPEDETIRDIILLKISDGPQRDQLNGIQLTKYSGGAS